MRRCCPLLAAVLVALAAGCGGEEPKTPRLVGPTPTNAPKPVGGKMNGPPVQRANRPGNPNAN